MTKNSVILLLGCFLHLPLLLACSSETPWDHAPSALREAFEVSRAASELPIDRLQTVSEYGTTGIGVSRERSVKAYVQKNMDTLQGIVADLSVLEAGSGPWADDASVTLGVLYLTTHAHFTWNPQNAIHRYRAIIDRSKAMRLKPWTRGQLGSVSGLFLASGPPEDQINESLQASFARTLVGVILVTEGPRAAKTQLVELHAAGQVTDDTLQVLSVVIDTYNLPPASCPRIHSRRALTNRGPQVGAGALAGV